MGKISRPESPAGFSAAGADFCADRGDLGEDLLHHDEYSALSLATSAAAMVHLPFRNPPGFLSVEENVRLLKGQTPPRTRAKDGRVVDMRAGNVQDLIDAGVLLCGTPDQACQQIVEFCDYCGGMGNLLMMGHAGFLNHEDTVDNLTLFAKDVLPRLQAYKQKGAEAIEVGEQPRCTPKYQQAP